MKYRICFLLTCFFFAEACFSADKNYCAEGSDKCTFVLLSEPTNKYEYVNKPRAKKRISPYSTFKIPNSLISLETGVVKDLQQTLEFDKKKYPVQKWWPPVWFNQPHTLRSAFKHSAVPIYQEIANGVGSSAMKSYLKRFDYGNRDISSGIDVFWLGGSLKISAVEQVRFLKGVYSNAFSLADSTLATLKDIMLAEETAEYKLYAKTGGGPAGDKTVIGWYVGFVESQAGVHYFALNMDAGSFGEVRERRIDMALYHLKQQGVI